MRFAEIMFYAEEEGLIKTRAGKINAVIRQIKKDPRPYIDQYDFERILNKNGLNFNELTRKELRKIESGIRA